MSFYSFVCYTVLALVVQVRAMGMHSSDIHTFIELCPRGAETLLIRILHILTEKGGYNYKVRLTN